MIKTVTLTANEVNSVAYPQRYPYFFIKNFSSFDVYASTKKSIFTADEDEVTRIPAESVGIVYSTLASECVNILSSESIKVEVIGAFDNNINFNKKIIIGGENYTKSEINTMLSEKADSSDIENVSNAVNTHVNDTSVHMTMAEKEKLANLQNYDDTQIKNNIALNLGSIGLKRKNLLKNIATSQEINGVTFTVNDDKTITANGTATAKTNFEFTATIKSGEYIFTGISEPATSSTVNMGIFNASTWKAFVALDKGSKFSVTEDTEVYVRLVVYEGYTADNVVFSPMVRYSDIIDDTYEPYTPSLQEQINEILARLTAGGI